MAKHLVLLGAGHAHLRTIHSIPRLLREGAMVTVVDQNERLYYSGMIPAVLGGRVAPEAAEIPIRRMVERGGGRFVRARAIGIDVDSRTVELETDGSVEPAGRSQLRWDVLSVAVGSTVRPPFPIADDAWEHTFGAKPVGGLPDLWGRLSELLGRQEAAGDRPVRLVVIGGGPSSVELAGNLSARAGKVAPEAAERLAITIVTRGSTILPNLPPEAAAAAADSLNARGITIRAATTVEAVERHAVRLRLAGASSGWAERADLVVVATGLFPPDLVRQSGLPHDHNGALLVNRDLQAANLPVFGGGDCIAIGGTPMQRIGVHAVRQGPILARNLLAAVRQANEHRHAPIQHRPDRLGPSRQANGDRHAPDRLGPIRQANGDRQDPDRLGPSRKGPDRQDPDRQAGLQEDRLVPRSSPHRVRSLRLARYDAPGNPMLILNLGDGTGVMIKGGKVKTGRLWMLLKERIDWGFVKREGRNTAPSVLGPPRG